MMKTPTFILFKVILLAHFFLTESASAQYFHTGQAPAGTRWMQIKHPKVQLIFPQDMEGQALSLSKSLDSLMPAVGYGLNHHPRRIPLVLYNSSIVSNGITAWAPRRMEFYTNPPQDNYAQDWLTQLAIHEYRHAVQIDKLNTGMTKVLGWALGEQGSAAVLGLYVPLWFMEGDAVVAETMLSRAGRGREPGFSARLRAQLEVNGIFPYEKAIFGSYCDFVPNQYELGYHLTALGIKHFGQEPWQQALDRTGRRPWGITSFSSGLKKSGGYTRGQWYIQALTRLDSLWQSTDSLSDIAAVPLLKQAPGIYTEFHRPQASSKGLILAERYSLNDIDRIVGIDIDGELHIIATPGLLMRGSLSVRANHALWAEYRFDPRWEQRSWSVLVHLNLTTGEKRILSERSRFFSPALSPDLQTIAAVETYPSGGASLVFLDLATGQVKGKWDDPAFIHLMQPAWHADSINIILLAQELSGAKHILTLNTRSGSSQSITGPVWTSLHHPVTEGGGVWYTGDAAGEEAIYWIDTLNKIPLLAATGKYGLAEAQPDGSGNLLAVEYTAQGYRPVRISSSSIITKQAPLTGGVQHYILEGWTDTMPPTFRETTNWAPEIKKYPRIPNLLRIHSWAPAFVDIDSRTLNPGLSIMSQDILNTSFLTAGYQYNYSEEYGEWQVQYRYEGWYPKLFLSGKTSHRSAKAFLPDGKQATYSWQEYQAEGGISLPQQWIKNHYWTGILPQITATRIGLDMDSGSPFRFKRDRLITFDYRFQVFRLHKQSQRDLQPRWGQVIEFRFRHDPFLREAGEIMAGTGILYFPGLLPHHGIRSYLGYQRRIPGEYLYAGMIRYPTGAISHGEKEISSYSVLYRLPLGMPDFNIPGIVLIKRVKGGLFFDWADGKTTQRTYRYRTLGGELRLDTHIFRFIAPVDVGLRLARDLEQARWVGEFLFTINFSDL